MTACSMTMMFRSLSAHAVLRGPTDVLYVFSDTLEVSLSVCMASVSNNEPQDVTLPLMKCKVLCKTLEVACDIAYNVCHYTFRNHDVKYTWYSEMKVAKATIMHVSV